MRQSHPEMAGSGNRSGWVDPLATDEERQLRKRRLIEGPQEFRDIRSNRAKISISDKAVDGLDWTEWSRGALGMTPRALASRLSGTQCTGSNGQLGGSNGRTYARLDRADICGAPGAPIPTAAGRKASSGF
jgi:hypothetical protein